MRKEQTLDKHFSDPGTGRAATLALLNDMVAQNAQAPRLRHPQPMGMGLPFPGMEDGPNSLAPSRTRDRYPGPHLQGVDPPAETSCFGMRSDSPHHISPYQACPIPKSYQL